MRTSIGFLGLAFVLGLATVGCEADVNGALDVKLGQAHAASAANDEASKALPPVSSLAVLGYQVSKNFHSDGLVRITLLPVDDKGGAILDDKIFVEIDATCNVPFPMNASVKIGEIRKPIDKKPFKFGIALDGSGSMDSADKDKLRVKATQGFIDVIGKNFQGSMFRADQFDTKVTKFFDFTADMEAAKAGVAKVSANGGTALHKSTAELIDAMSQLPDDKYQPALLVLSDGMDNSSEGVTREQVIAKAKEKKIQLYAVGLGGGLDVPGLSFVGDLQAYAQETGGVFTFVKNASDLDPMFQKLANGATKGQVFTDISLKGGTFIPFSTITIKFSVHAGGKVMQDSIEFIVPVS
jgi:hypothetical protein